MSKIMYLIGAGASAQALPVIANIPSRIDAVISALSAHPLGDSYFEQHLSVSSAQCIKELIEDLEWMKVNSAAHATVDTFAKKLRIRGQVEELKRLKRALSIFFTIEQALHKPDPRYDSFFASILSSAYKAPNDLGIISWNYDNQFEHTLCDYLGNNTTLTSAHSQLKCVIKYNEDGDLNPEGLLIIKLNGSASLENTSSRNHCYYLENLTKFDENEVKTIAKHYGYSKYLNHLRSLLSFSWEQMEPELKRTIADNTADTEVLVIIGYSFPYFNREVDRMIIDSMPKLKTVYFQDLHPENIMSRFKAISTKKFEMVAINDIEQFFLPPEL